MNTVTITGTVPEWTISDRLRKAREQTGLNQEDFANDLGVSRGTVKNYECGSNTYKRPILLAWAMRSGVPLEWLRSGQQSAPQPGEPDEGRVVRREGLEPPTRWFTQDSGCGQGARVIPIRRLRPLKVLPLKVVPLRLVPALTVAPPSAALRAA